MDAKKKRAQLSAAQAETPQVAVEALHVDIAATRRRAADAERTRCEAESISAEYTRQLELLARQLEEARAMQRRAREAADRATLATPPAPQTSEIIHNTTSPTPMLPPPNSAPMPPAPPHAAISTTSVQQQHPYPAHSPQQAPVAPVVAQSTAPQSTAAVSLPSAQPAAPMPTAPSPGNDMQPIVIPPPSMQRNSAGSSAAAPAQQAPIGIPAPFNDNAVVTASTAVASTTDRLPPVVIPPPQDKSVGRDRLSPSGPSHPTLNDSSAPASARARTAGAIQQNVVPVHRHEKKAPQTRSHTAGDTVLAHRHDVENRPAQPLPSEVASLLWLA